MSVSQLNFVKPVRSNSTMLMHTTQQEGNIVIYEVVLPEGKDIIVTVWIRLSLFPPTKETAALEDLEKI